MEYIAIAVGGTYECWARYGSPTIYEHDFPHATLSTNVLGSFLMAFPLIETFEPLERLTIAPEHRSGLLIDVLYILTGDYAAGRSLLLSRAHMLLALCKRAAMPVELTVEQAARLARRSRMSADYAPLMCQMVQKRAQSRTTLTTVTSDINLAISSAIRAMRSVYAFSPPFSVGPDASV